MPDQHPLRKAGDRWHFSQPNLGFRAKYVCIDKDGGRAERPMQYLSTCREGVVSQARKEFQDTFTKKSQSGQRIWDFSFEKGSARIDLSDPTAKKAGDTKLLINASVLTRAEQIVFLQVSDYLVGNVCVLLNPDERVEGEWWRTEPDDYLVPDTAGNNCVGWNGSDNFFLHHPALLSLITGLYRQALLLTRGGFGAEILKTVPREKVDKAMTTGSWRQALSNCKKLRQWIEVYTPKGAYQINFPFPEGYWLRFMRLHQALRRHGYQEVFEQDFTAAWNLLAKNTNWSGMYNFWGNKKGEERDGNSKQARRRLHLMKLGKPQERNSTSEGKPAPAAS